MSGLNGLESWNLNIQSEYSICMKAAGIVHASGAARCEAYVALGCTCTAGSGPAMLGNSAPNPVSVDRLRSVFN